jgi:hypothetical protein
MPGHRGAASRRPGSPLPFGVAGLLAAAAMIYGGVRLAEGGAEDDGVRYQPASRTARLNEAGAFVARDIFRVVDFDWRGDRLYLVDAAGALVVGLERAGADGWRERLRIDVRGGGPGELEQPVSVAVRGDGSLAVLDARRLVTFAADGQPLQTRTLELPCHTRRGILADLDAALYLAATCVDGAPASDTVSALLWRVTDDAPIELARAPRFTRDARWGNAFTTERVLGSGSDRLLFGAGLDACVWTVAGAAAVTDMECDVARTRFRSEPPAELLALESLPQHMRGRAWQWQRTLPYYHDVVAAPSADILVRLWSADSVVLRTTALAPGGERDLLVAPFKGLIGCRAGGRLWRLADDDVAGLRLVGLEMALLETLLRDGPPPGVP